MLAASRAVARRKNGLRLGFTSHHAPFLPHRMNQSPASSCATRQLSIFAAPPNSFTGFPLLQKPADNQSSTVRQAPRGTRAMLTESKPLGVGSAAPDFALEEPLTGRTVSLQEARGDNGLLVVFMCNHCPFVVHLERGLGNAGKKASELGIGMVGISSNDVDNYPADSPAKMKKMAARAWSSFKYLYDPTQQAALNYKAVCTPDIFLFDKDMKLFYHGQFDDSRPGNRKPVTGKSLFEAMEEMTGGGAPVRNASPSIGCSIKWKPGNYPS